MPDELTQLERDVLVLILAPAHPVMDALRRQVERCHVTSREVTGVRFFTTLAPHEGAECAQVKPSRLDLGDVTGNVEGLEHGVGFVLFVQDGLLDMLEGFSYADPWTDLNAPYTLAAGGVAHLGGSKADLEEVDDAMAAPE